MALAAERARRRYRRREGPQEAPLALLPGRPQAHRPVRAARSLPSRARTYRGTESPSRSALEWKRQKKIVGPAFQHERIRVVHPAMTGVADELVAAIEREADLDEVQMHDWTRKATVEIIGKAGFGHTFHALRGEDHTHGGPGEDEGDEEQCGEGSLELYENVVKELANPVHLFDPIARMTGARSRMAKLLDGFDELLQTLIDEKRRSIDKRASNGEAGEELQAKDLLDMLIQ